MKLCQETREEIKRWVQGLFLAVCWHCCRSKYVSEYLRGHLFKTAGMSCSPRLIYLNFASAKTTLMTHLQPDVNGSPH